MITFLQFVTIVHKLGIPGLSQSFSVLACDPQWYLSCRFTSTILYLLRILWILTCCFAAKN